jgi:hydrogenase nickel incorporation protein HypA/HybF
MTEALRMAEEAAKSAGAKRILKLRLRLGLLSGVVPESMAFAFDVVSRGTLRRARYWTLNRCRRRAGAPRARRNLRAWIF